MKSDLKSRIYQAQCYGDVEPIEYMVPYPNIGSLIEGQNVKHADFVVYDSIQMTNRSFFEHIQQTAHWLESKGLNPRDRLYLPPLAFPQSEILAFGVWYVGATVVLSKNKSESRLNQIQCKDFIPETLNLFDTISSFDTDFFPKHKPQLNEEGLIYVQNDDSIQLSHYNLLVNVNGVQQSLGLLGGETIYSELEATSMEWTIFQALLPFYAASLYSNNNPDFFVGYLNQSSEQTHTFSHEISQFQSLGDKDILLCPENTCVLSIGKKPIHMTGVQSDTKALLIEGHSVMMGYLNNDEKNNRIFKQNRLIIDLFD